ncbi:MAG: WecB/TagA/CpsF family glycosyltransferase [Candidatus Adiutricales bacterium]
MIERYPILNIWVDSVDIEQVLASVVEFIEQGDRPHTIFASNPEKNFSVPKDDNRYEVFKNADLLLPDGIGMVYAARLLHGIRLKRVTGVKVMEEICRLAGKRKYRIFIYGAKEEVNAASVDILSEQFPGINIVGRANGYLPQEDMSNLIQWINESGAQILFLALGSPKQEQWFAAHKIELTSIRVCQGIGGTLDTIGGNVRLAPEAWRNRNLEWLYRLLKEPKRIKRQKVLPVFGIMILYAKLKMLLDFRR